ncbi:MAG: hypothetical protein VKP72_05340 [bacterium]|nr:hypothetical protein [bacterium]
MDLQILFGVTAIVLLAGTGMALSRSTSLAQARSREAGRGMAAAPRARQAVYPCQACGIRTHELTRVRERHTGKVLGIYCRTCGEQYRG